MSIKVNHNINLLTSNSKADKTNNLLSQFVVKFLQLAPANMANKHETVCRYSTPGCRESCLIFTGNGRYPKVINGRTNKTLFYLNDNGLFMEKLMVETAGFQASTRIQDKVPCIRPNALSDIPWEQKHPEYMERFPDTIFYDYTKYPYLERPDQNLPKNYSLVYSRSDKSSNWEIDINLNNGRSVAVVFRDELPEKYCGVPVVDGDKHDLTFLHSAPCIIGLRAKGLARKDTTGFVV
jgi:hypothetical protein|tara:strand:- start:1540 stop:2250 length:711 start_codon:yes stop_codon:yes gene_type:complete